MGIGRTCAELLASKGWRVVIAARGEAPARKAAAALPGSGHEVLRLDVARGRYARTGGSAHRRQPSRIHGHAAKRRVEGCDCEIGRER